jgi:ABC-type phosphate/phosphonate transport system permease subunit
LNRSSAGVSRAQADMPSGARSFGQLLWKYIRPFNHAETAGVLIVIVLTVSIPGVFSARLRETFI